MRAWMNRAMVFSVPSVSVSSGASEGFGMVFAEAQAMGLPVVSSASGGIVEVVAHGKTGFLVKERDESDIAASILQLFDREALWQVFSEAGRQRMVTQFNLLSQSKALEDIYLMVGGGGSRNT